jgi:hypothetical protein
MRLWNPLAEGPTIAQRQVENTTTAIVFSPDGSILSQGFGDGIRLFEIADTI